jgi:hypothetical protein
MVNGPCAGVRTGVVLLGRASLHILAPQTNIDRYEKPTNYLIGWNKKELPE